MMGATMIISGYVYFGMFLILGSDGFCLDNQAGMDDALSSTAQKVSASLSGLHNSFLGQMLTQARLNTISSYDQSNELLTRGSSHPRLQTKT